jgi:drug/metabolite transporter (DMT)-like permease
LSQRWTVYARLLLTVVFWGGSFIATKVAVREAAPATVVWLRFLLGLLVLGAVLAARRQIALVPRHEVAYFALLGFLGITLHQWLQSNGLLTAQASTSAWIVATTPIFIALLGWLVLKEKLRLAQMAGIALATAGVLLVVSRGDLAALTAGRFGAPGDFLILASAPNWAVFSVLSRRGLRRYPAALMLFYVMALGWLFTTGLVLLGPGLADVARLSGFGWLAVFFLGPLCSGLAYIWYFDALERLPASQVGAFIYLEPLVTAGVAAALLGEALVWATLAGGAVILLGVRLVQQRGGRPVGAA